MDLNFATASLNAFGYAWDFGDGSTSNLVSPTHTYYNNTGFLDIYEVSLIAYNINGCNDTVRRMAHFRVKSTICEQLNTVS
jgi:PKD repeat protein